MLGRHALAGDVPALGDGMRSSGGCARTEECSLARASSCTSRLCPLRRRALDGDVRALGDGMRLSVGACSSIRISRCQNACSLARAPTCASVLRMPGHEHLTLFF